MDKTRDFQRPCGTPVIAFLGAILPFAPGGTLPSADKWAAYTTRVVELHMLKSWHGVLKSQLAVK